MQWCRLSNTFCSKKCHKQVCIPVGCVPPTSVAATRYQSQGVQGVSVLGSVSVQGVFVQGVSAQGFCAQRVSIWGCLCLLVSVLGGLCLWGSLFTCSLSGGVSVWWGLCPGGSLFRGDTPSPVNRQTGVKHYFPANSFKKFHIQLKGHFWIRWFPFSIFQKACPEPTSSFLSRITLLWIFP